MRYLIGIGFWFFLCAEMAFAAPPVFVPPQVIKDLPKRASMIHAELEELAKDNDAISVAFDVHGVLSKELEPSREGKLTFSNRFLPTLKLAASKGRVLALSAHDQPEVLYQELRSLQYGTGKDQTVFRVFVDDDDQPKKKGLILFPLAGGNFRIVEYSKYGNIVSARTPTSQYHREKAVAALIQRLDHKELASLELSRDLYARVRREVESQTSKMSATLFARAAKYMSLNCVSWQSSAIIEKFALASWHNAYTVESLINGFNEVIEKEVCGRIQKGRRVYPNGRPTPEQKEAFAADFKDAIQAFLDLRNDLLKSLNPKDIEAAIVKMRATTAKSKFMFIEDSFDNLTSFQDSILDTGYFEDSTIYLQLAQRPDQDKDLEPDALRKILKPFEEKSDLKDSN